MRSALVTVALVLGAAHLYAASGQAVVRLLRTPDSGIQPQAATDPQGNIHLIYYTGNPEGGDVFYVCRPQAKGEFSAPMRVNATPGSATAMGSIRGAQLAVGKDSRVHVVWNGMGTGSGRALVGDKQIAPLYYARLNDQKSSFEPERNMITIAPGLDGGSSVAADDQGNVYVTWHAPRPGGSHEDESERAVFIAISGNEGKSFQPEANALPEAAGTCACCGMRAFADNSGSVYILFRSATDGVNRDALLLVSKNQGRVFSVAHRHNWKTSTCPMSSASLAQATDGVIAAWETAGQVYSAQVNPRSLQVSTPLHPGGESPRKHPVVAGNRKGDFVLVWTEGTAWSKGGSIAWQVYAADGKPIAEQGHADGLPAWSFATACAGSNGEFYIIY